MAGQKKTRPRYVRAYEIFLILCLLFACFQTWRGARPPAAPVAKNIPDAVYATPASYRRHRRYRYGLGGK